MKTSDFDYPLPPEQIAQTPLSQRDKSRLLVLNRQTGQLAHQQFTDIMTYLQSGDVLVGNNSRVMPARLYGHKPTGGKVELLLLSPLGEHRWRVLAGGKKLRVGTKITVDDHVGNPSPLQATITQILDGGQREVQFNQSIQAHWDILGHTPLPPYIHQQLANDDRYQTIYAHPMGSAAAPTAGLHFTPEVMLALRERGVRFETVTLHVGLDTFKPVTTETVTAHTIHTEWVELTAETAQRLNEAKLAGKRIIAVGTTSVRVLETAAWRSAGIQGSLQHVSKNPQPEACPWRPVSATTGQTDLYIYPGYNFRVVDALITNFHMPQSTLMMLVSAFAGIEPIRQAYQTALDEGYRFLSFGDAMLIL